MARLSLISYQAGVMSVTLLRRKIVVVFDICSSTAIVERLAAKQEVDRYRVLIRDIKRHLVDEQKNIDFSPYKFVGDGWILLFASDVQGIDLLKFLKELCLFYRKLHAEVIADYLDSPLPVVGINFGIDKGILFPMKLIGEEEFFGRPLNVACRLQGANKQGSNDPAYKALVSKVAYKENFASAINGFKTFDTTRELHNLQDGAAFSCKEIVLLSAETA